METGVADNKQHEYKSKADNADVLHRVFWASELLTGAAVWPIGTEAGTAAVSLSPTTPRPST